MDTVHTMESMLNLRVHIAPVGFEIDRVVVPAAKMKADLVYLVVDRNIATDKSTKFQTEIIKKLKRKKIDSKVVYANRLQLFDIIRVVKEIILDHRNEQQTYGVEEIYGLPTYQLLTPNKDLIEILKIIKENDGRIQKKVLAEIAEDRKILNINAREENHSQARFASLDKKLIQPLMHTWNFIEEEKIGKNRWIFFTDDGKNASEFLF